MRKMKLLIDRAAQKNRVPGMESGGSAPGEQFESERVSVVEQTRRGYIGGAEVVTLRFIAAINRENPAGMIEIDGAPEFRMVIEGGVDGDVGTSAIEADSAQSGAGAAPALRTMADIPVVSLTGGIRQI